ncbi:AraC family transcriptional regulator [Pseudomonas citronellolis]|uniref:AraC family transcriptional regulator n=1 Tax=Pseudomonas citronellolis TaxID=53408 RepID=UPI0023E36CFB|nr:AraC family transcriptional regulator [Pseudomonas citronellolis]MDF3932997.1 AraC family transcriptional regulator [Pseudomonas citronellolis]
MALRHGWLGDGVEVASAALSGHRFDKHSHDEFVISANLRGAEQVWLDGRTFAAGAGDITLYNPGQIQGGGAADGEPWRFVSLYLPEAALAESLGLARVAFERPLLQQPALAGELAAAVELALSGDVFLRERGEERLTLLLAELARHAGTRPPAATALGRRPVDRLQELLAANLAEPLGLDAMAAQVQVSKFHLLRAFKQHTGLSPRQWAMQLRTRRALALLRAGRPVGEVAHALGFADQSHLTRYFSNAYGISPGRYQRALRG